MKSYFENIAVLFCTLVSQCFIYTAGSCEQYETITKLVQECRRQEGLLHILKELSVGGYAEYMDELTQSELVEDIQAFCRNVIPKYKECIRRSNVIHLCGNSEDVSQLTTDWLSIYCTGENVADWLAEYVAYGFNYKHTCSINNMSLKCYFNQVFKGNGTHRLNDETINEYNSWAKRYASKAYFFLQHLPIQQWHQVYCKSGAGEEYYQKLMTDWFACTEVEMPRIQRLFPQCTSPWQDVLLTDWLYNSVYYKPGLWLYPEQMSQLLALKEEAVNRTQSFEYYSDF